MPDELVDVSQRHKDYMHVSAENLAVQRCQAQTCTVTMQREKGHMSDELLWPIVELYAGGVVHVGSLSNERFS